MKPLKEVIQKHSGSVTPTPELRVGSVIEHNKYGRGEVRSLGQLSGEPTITVDFGVVGIKKLMLKFAKFNILKF